MSAGPGAPDGAARRALPRSALVAAGLIALVAAIYWPVHRHGFVAYDDPKYVVENPSVRAGLTGAGVAWALGTMHASNWHPLTWLSHMLDVQLFGLDPGWHHATSVALHALNAVLLFLFLARATGSRWRSALVAALFAAHPLAVESVAWVAERKNVLSTALLLAALLAWHAWIRAPSRRRYAAVVIAFGAGLMAKPMLVTFPAVLLVLDGWPFARLRRRSDLWPLVREKLPLLGMSALSSALTVLAQDRGGALIGADALPIAVRVPNAILAGGLYLWRAAWPAELAVFYPHPGASWSPWQVAAAAGALAALGALAVWQRRERPFLLAGWLWYAITLLPVIGLVQVGLQATADRYTYVPLIGVFIGIAWSLPEAGRAWTAGACSAALLAAALAARAQVGVWRDSTSLFQHAADAVPGNWLAHKNLGVEQFQAGDLPRALRSFEAALRLRSQDADLWADVGTCQLLLGRLDASVEALGRAVRLDPGDAEMWLNLGLANALLGRGQETAVALARLRELDPQRARLLESRLPELASRRQ